MDRYHGNGTTTRVALSAAIATTNGMTSSARAGRRVKASAGRSARIRALRTCSLSMLFGNLLHESAGKYY